MVRGKGVWVRFMKVFKCSVREFGIYRFYVYLEVFIDLVVYSGGFWVLVV